MILRRSAPSILSIVVFAVIGGVIVALALGVGLSCYLRCRWHRKMWQRELYQESARSQNIIPSRGHSIPPHMSFGYPPGSLFPQAPKIQDGWRGTLAPQPQKSSTQSSELDRSSAQPSQGQLFQPKPIGYDFAGFRNRTPSANPRSSTATSSWNANSAFAPAANISRTSTPKPIPPSATNASKSNTPTSLHPATNSHASRAITPKPFRLAVIPASPLVLETNHPADVSSSGSEYSQPSDPGTGPGGAIEIPSAMAARLRALERHSPQIDSAPQGSTTSRPLPPAISLPAPAHSTVGRTRIPSLHAHFTPVREKAPALPPPTPNPHLPDFNLHPARRPSSTPSTDDELMGLTDLQKAQFPPKLVLQPLPQTKYQLDEHPYSGGPAPGKTASEATDIGMAATDISTTSTSHGEPTNRAFAKSWKHKTWARRFKDREQFPNQFEALVASEVSEGSDGGFGVGVREGEMANTIPHTPYGVPGILKSRERFGSTLTISSPLRDKKSGAYFSERLD